MKDKVIVITGGTKGLGKSLALECARLGVKVTIGGRNAQDGRSIVKKIENDYGIDALFVEGDLSSVTNCERLISSTIDAFKSIDGLVNYAGIAPHSKITEVEEDEFDDVFNINIKAPFFCTKFAVRSMLKSGGGSIVNVGTPHAYGGEVDRATYATSKGALLSLTKHISKNYAKYHIRANWITMGWVPTPGEIERRAKFNVTPDELEAIGKETIPMGRLQTIEDHVPMILILLSDQTSQITGTEIHLTGGDFK